MPAETCTCRERPGVRCPQHDQPVLGRFRPNRASDIADTLADLIFLFRIGADPVHEGRKATMQASVGGLRDASGSLLSAETREPLFRFHFHYSQCAPVLLPGEVQSLKAGLDF